MSNLIFYYDNLSVDDVMHIYQYANWTANRSKEQVQKILENTDVTILGKIDDKPIAFARVVTDRCIRGFLEDIIIVPEHRGTQVVNQLFKEIEKKTLEAGVDRLEGVSLLENKRFYEKRGWIIRKEYITGYKKLK